MKHLAKLAAALSVAAALVPVQAVAVTGDIPFNGGVSDSCVINVGGSGTMQASSDFQTFSSRDAYGGTAGTAQVLATSTSFSLSADAPATFSTAPATGNDNVSFTAYYQTTSGPTSIGETTGSTATPLNRGNHQVEIDLEAVKTLATDTFEQGTYAATVTLRCE